MGGVSLGAVDDDGRGIDAVGAVGSNNGGVDEVKVGAVEGANVGVADGVKDGAVVAIPRGRGDQRQSVTNNLGAMAHGATFTWAHLSNCDQQPVRPISATT